MLKNKSKIYRAVPVSIMVKIILNRLPEFKDNSHQVFLPHQNLAKSHHLSSDAKDSKPLNYINTDIREQNIYNYD